MPILPEIVTFVKFSGENSERVINKNILIANALWEMILGIIINPWILRIYIVLCRYVTNVMENGDLGI